MTSILCEVGDDGARGLMRLSRPTLESMSLSPGDTVAVEAEGKTFARVMPASVDDNAALVDRWLAKNAGLAERGTAKLTPIELPHLDALVVRLPSPEATDSDRLRDQLFDMPVSVGDKLPVQGADPIEVVEASPGAAGIVTQATILTFEAPADRSLGYEGLGGLEAEIARVHEMISAPLLRPELFARLGLSAPRGVLFSGPPGSGKTLLARAVAARTKAAFFAINAPEIVSKHYGESEAALRKTFAAAAKSSPAIIFIDEIDAIAPARGELSSEKQVERRIVAQLLTLLDGLSDRGKVVVMAATNLPDAIDPALRRPGRFDREVRFKPPSETDRADILRVQLAKAPLAEDVDLSVIASGTRGYVGADLAALAREAAVAALSRTVEEAGGEANVDLAAMFVRQQDLLAGLNATEPSALRGDRTEAAPVAWSDVGGLDHAKALLEQSVLAPLRHPKVFDEFGVSPPRGILLSGPPGTGKTLLARALASEADMNFLPVRPPRLISQFLGEAERSISALFERARQTAPTLLFFDELDSLAPRRGPESGATNRIVGQLLIELDGLEPNKGVVVLAATNRPTSIDPALVRPGRFDSVVDVALPDARARQAILAVHLEARPKAEELDLQKLAAETEGLSGADLAALVAAAARRAVNRLLTGGTDHGITMADLEASRRAIVDAQRARLDDHIGEVPA